MSTIKVDTSEIDKFAVVISNYPATATNKVKNAVRTSTFNVERYAKDNITKNGNVDTGHLRRSVTSKVSTFEGIVSNNVKYARIIEEGSKAHKIRPRVKKALYWKGASHPVKEVNHPGTKPYPFLEPALKKEESNFLKELEKAVELP